MKVCIQSIIRFKEEEGYEFYVLHSDLNESDKIEIEESFNESDVRIHFIYVDPSSFKDFATSFKAVNVHPAFFGLPFINKTFII